MVKEDRHTGKMTWRIWLSFRKLLVVWNKKLLSSPSFAELAEAEHKPGTMSLVPDGLWLEKSNSDLKTA